MFVARSSRRRPEEHNQRLAALHAKLPDDYLELVGQTDGLEIEDCSIFGLGRIRELAGDDANYYLLAELAGVGTVGVRCDGTDGAVAFLPYDGHIESFPDFRSAVESYLTRPRRGERRAN